MYRVIRQNTELVTTRWLETRRANDSAIAPGQQSMLHATKIITKGNEYVAEST